MRISSYGCTWEVWRALKKLELLSATPRATLTHFSCSPNFPRASVTRYTHAKHEHILKYIYIYIAHPPHLKRSIPYSQALRLWRICSPTDTLKKRILECSDFFVACGYAQRKVLHEMQKVLTLTQEECLQTKEREPTDRIPLVTTFNPHTTFICRNC